MEKGAISYAKVGDKYILKLTGEVRYQMGYSFDDFLKQLFKREDFDDIVLDLTETQMIDSTCLGLLAKIAKHIDARFERKATVFSTNDDINQVLDSMGFNTVFNICTIDPKTPADMEKVAVSAADQANFAKTLYEAHRMLCEMNEKNRIEFKNVMDALQEKINSI